jgi:hypothetical protein
LMPKYRWVGIPYSLGCVTHQWLEFGLGKKKELREEEGEEKGRKKKKRKI